MSAAATPTYLLTAASGNIGKHLVPLLLSHATKPILILPTSNAERLKASLPTGYDPLRIRVVEGSIQDPTWTENVLRDNHVSAVFLCLTGDNELFTTFNFFDAIKQSGSVKHLVYLSAAGDFSLDAVKAGALQNIAAAHVAVKFIVEAKLRHGLLPRSEQGGFGWTIIGPTIFFSNDFRSKKALLEQGLFDEPVGSKGVSRVDAQDIALGVANALIDDGQQWGGKKIPIGSLKTYSQNDTAGIWSKALEKEVRPFMSDAAGLKDFETHFAAKAGPAWARDLRLMYEIFEVQKFGMTKEDYDNQVKLLGRQPASYEAFVERAAKEWLASGA